MHNESNELHGALEHYHLFNVKGHDYDMLLKNSDDAAASYIFHVKRLSDQQGAHLSIYKGATVTDSPEATVTFETSLSGQLAVKDSNNEELSITWNHPATSSYSEFRMGSETLRWYKTYQKRRIPFRVHREKYMEWQFYSLTDAEASSETGSRPIGRQLASLVLENPDPVPRQRFIHAAKEGGETGSLVWLQPVDEQVRTAANMLVLTAWHRDRQIFYGASLIPGLEIQSASRTLGRVGAAHGMENSAAWAAFAT